MKTLILVAALVALTGCINLEKQAARDVEHAKLRCAVYGLANDIGCIEREARAIADRRAIPTLTIEQKD